MAVAADTSPVASDFVFGYTIYRRCSQLGLTSWSFCYCSWTLCCLLGSALLTLGEFYQILSLWTRSAPYLSCQNKKKASQQKFDMERLKRISRN